MALTLVDSFNVDNPGGGTRQVQFLWGDLTQLSSADAVTTLVVSAFPGDYTPSPGSLIGALANAGVSVQALSQNKAASYEPQMPVWMSQQVSSTNPGIQFQRVLVYEPANPQQSSLGLVWSIFQGLSCYYGTGANTVAMPLVSTGSGGVDLTAMLTALFWAAAHACSKGPFPLNTVKIVVYTQAQAQALAPAFASLKSQYQNVFSLSLPGGYASFVSQAQSTISGRLLPSTVTNREAVAVCIYSSNYYGQINSTLRNNQPSDPAYQQMMPLFEAIDSGLWNMTYNNGASNRGENMTPQRRAQYVVGAVITNVAYTSTSLGSGFPASDHLIIQGTTGSQIWPYSIYVGEQEVLFERGLTFTVTARACNGNDPPCTFNVTQNVTNWCGGS